MSRPRAGGLFIMSLDDLPDETLEEISRYLAPDDLVTFAQLNRACRRTAKLSRLDLVNRLLVYELKPEYAGWHDRRPDVDRWMDPTWHHSHFACSGCLRIRHHFYFDNHSICALRLRKPHPENAVYWRTMYGAHHRRAKRRDLYHMLKLARRRDDQGAMDDIEMKLCGSMRHHRLCIECRFRRGRYRFRTSVSQHVEFPIITSRQYHYYTDFERWYPELYLPIPEPHPCLHAFTAVPKYSYNWSLYMARCPQCATWKELCAFIDVSARSFDWKETIRPMPCRACRPPEAEVASIAIQTARLAITEIFRPIALKATLERLREFVHSSPKLQPLLSAFEGMDASDYRFGMEDGLRRAQLFIHLREEHVLRSVLLNNDFSGDWASCLYYLEDYQLASQAAKHVEGWMAEIRSDPRRLKEHLRSYRWPKSPPPPPVNHKADSLYLVS